VEAAGGLVGRHSDLRGQVERDIIHAVVRLRHARHTPIVRMSVETVIAVPAVFLACLIAVQSSP